jgi:hypothetical protein
MRTTRGQAGIEFVIIVGVALLVLSASLFIYFDTASATDSLGNQAAAAVACNHVAVTIASVASGGNGTQAALHLPATIGNSNYTISVNGTARIVTVNYTNGFQACPIPTSNVTTNTSINKSGTVRNIGGVVIG